MSRPDDVINIALAEVGYQEKRSNASLDDKTANAGANNWTKYARDLAAAGYYNGNKNGYAWCDCFVDWCFFKAFGAVEGQRIQCQTGPLGAACIYSAQYYQQKGRYDQTPRIGDQVFFHAGGTIGHTGIVVAVTSSTITTVEGNSGDQVKKNTYNRNIGYIAGYGHPLYDGQASARPDEETPVAEGPAVAEEPSVVETSGTITVSVESKELSNGSIGPQVKTLQRLIRASGANPGIDVDGEFGPITKAGVIYLQKRCFPGQEAEWDGIVGRKTWAAILTALN